MRLCIVVTLDAVGNRSFCRNGENCIVAGPDSRAPGPRGRARVLAFGRRPERPPGQGGRHGRRACVARGAVPVPRRAARRGRALGRGAAVGGGHRRRQSAGGFRSRPAGRNAGGVRGPLPPAPRIHDRRRPEGRHVRARAVPGRAPGDRHVVAEGGASLRRAGVLPRLDAGGDRRTLPAALRAGPLHGPAGRDGPWGRPRPSTSSCGTFLPSCGVTTRGSRSSSCCATRWNARSPTTTWRKVAGESAGRFGRRCLLEPFRRASSAGIPGTPTPRSACTATVPGGSTAASCAASTGCSIATTCSSFARKTSCAATTTSCARCSGFWRCRRKCACRRRSCSKANPAEGSTGSCPGSCACPMWPSSFGSAGCSDGDASTTGPETARPDAIRGFSLSWVNGSRCPM